MRAELLDAFVATISSAKGWNNVVRGLPGGVLTLDRQANVASIRMPAFPDYDTDAPERSSSERHAGLSWRPAVWARESEV